MATEKDKMAGNGNNGNNGNAANTGKTGNGGKGQEPRRMVQRGHLWTIWRLSIKELKLLLGDPLLMIFIAFAFIISNISSYEVAVQMGVQNARVGIIDEDRTQLSYLIRDSLMKPEFNVDKETISHERANNAFDRGEYSFILDIPQGFEKDVLSGGDGKIQLMVDATQMSLAGVGSAYIITIVNEEIGKWVKKFGETDMEPPVRERIFVKYNEKLLKSNEMALNQTIINTSLLAILLVGAAVIREREHGTMEHLLVMPVSFVEILFSKIFANGFVIMVGNIFCTLYINKYVLQVPINGSVALFALGCAIFLFAEASIGVLLATMAPNMPQFVLVGLLFIWLSQLTSGGMSPLDSLPLIMQKLVEFDPNTHFIRSSAQILMKGADLSVVWVDFALLLVIGSGLLMLAMMRFKKMMESAG